jgi:transketolase
LDFLTGKRIRQLILEISHQAQVGHIGSALSVADIIAALFAGVLNGVGEPSKSRDRFILSKGHAALAMYAALYCLNIIDSEQLESYCQDGTLLGTHPEHALVGIDFSTGSLGQGLSIGVGSALGARLSDSSRRTFVLLSDAECNEGSVWEAVMFAGHHKLNKLTAIVDFNGQQAMGYTSDILNQDNLAQRWEVFGWEVHEVDGHDAEVLKAVITREASDKPRVIIANTQAGYSVSFMERQVKWHYMPMTEREFQQAITEVEARE